jgi:hypothetical protein
MVNDRQEKLTQLMCREFKYCQITHLSLLLKTDKMNPAYNESESEGREREYLLLYEINYIFPGGRRPPGPLSLQ